MTVDTAAPAGTVRTRGRRRWADILVWLLVLVFAAWTALRVTGFDAGFRWVQLVAFTPYVAAASPAVPVLALLLRRRAAGTAGLVVTLTLAGCVLPRALPQDGPAVSGPVLRVLAANLAVGAADHRALIELVRAERADVLALAEVTPDAAEGLDGNGLRGLLPHRVDTKIRSGVGGSAIYSRFPLRALTPIDLGNFAQSRALVTMPGDRRVEVTSVHPCAPRFAYKHACWLDGLRALPRAPESGPHQVLAGDFNATLDHAPVRDLIASGYRDAANATGNGLLPTWPAKGWETVPGITLDRILADERIAVRAFRAHPLAGTDHKATFAELRLP
ncbi:endonuclease [Microtetraspora sp. NBRC 13810]|uniref:endonuclease/exonuclease/phosphatase family protein n=1 Tax=Microtetraspora sp. NBRC 13810 TaxID=3030990 RepID=UPI0024A3574F|nr:endonuclease/exonuclease/phosphatase family protein [Microtetraspora sp. NBRC 13810]GLW10646.1 endonuclease [Microtetraspora sp. NBRC 13810]